MFRNSAAASVSGYVLIPFFEGRNAHRTAVPSFNPWDVSQHYYTTHLFQVVCLTVGAILNTIVDTMFASLCTISYAELRILKRRFKNLDYSLPSRIVKGQLKRNALFHLEILKVTNLTEQFFTYGILVQFLSSIFVICFTGFQMMLIPTLSSDFFHFVIYLACMLSQVSIFCCYGHFVTNESSDIGESIYLSNWYMSDVSVRKDVLILMENTKKPILLTAGKFFPLVMSTLTAILRSSYSFLAVLQQMD